MNKDKMLDEYVDERVSEITKQLMENKASLSDLVWKLAMYEQCMIQIIDSECDSSNLNTSIGLIFDYFDIETTGAEELLKKFGDIVND